MLKYTKITGAVLRFFAGLHRNALKSEINTARFTASTSMLVVEVQAEAVARARENLAEALRRQNRKTAQFDDVLRDNSKIIDRLDAAMQNVVQLPIPADTKPLIISKE